MPGSDHDTGRRKHCLTTESVLRHYKGFKNGCSGEGLEKDK